MKRKQGKGGDYPQNVPKRDSTQSTQFFLQSRRVQKSQNFSVTGRVARWSDSCLLNCCGSADPCKQIMSEALADSYMMLLVMNAGNKRKQDTKMRCLRRRTKDGFKGNIDNLIFHRKKHILKSVTRVSFLLQQITCKQNAQSLDWITQNKAPKHR